MSLEPVECVRLFDQLDGRDLAVAGRRWRMAVFSVTRHDGMVWIQLGVEGERTCRMRVVQLGPGQGVRQALRDVMGWLTTGPAIDWPPTAQMA